MIDFKKIKKIHFIGIGGIGISALARYFLKKGYQVVGSDLVENTVTQELKELGARIIIGPHQKSNLEKNSDLLIYSLAIRKNKNPEYRQAQRLKIKSLSFPAVLGQLTRNQFLIAVAGTHGKTTTCALASLILTKAKFDPTVVIGSYLKEFGGNLRIGQSKFWIIEACEYQEAFLNYQPDIIILTNIEPEHLDYYRNFDNELKAFKKFILQLSSRGILIANQDDKYIKKIVRGFKKKIIWFSLKKKPRDLRLLIPGQHNLANALAARNLAQTLNINQRIISQVFKNYRGAWRRFEIRKKGGLTLIDDYAHHPTEIKATLKATREKFPARRIWAVFQPHQYHRTWALFKKFTQSFALADRVIITDIYAVAGREDTSLKKKVSSLKLVGALQKQGIEAVYIKKFDSIVKYLLGNVKNRDIILIMGAGDILKVYEKLVLKL